MSQETMNGPRRYGASDLAALDPTSAARFTELTGHPVQGPFAAWIERPELMRPILKVFAALRDKVDLPVKLQKLMILVVARHYSAPFEWATHAPLAIKAGLNERIIEEINLDRSPDFDDPAEEITYMCTRELLKTNRLSDLNFQRAESILGREQVVELIAAMGFFVMVAITLNAFDIRPSANAMKLADLS